MIYPREPIRGNTMETIIMALMLTITPLVTQENATSGTYELDEYEYCTIVNPTLPECIELTNLTKE